MILKNVKSNYQARQIEAIDYSCDYEKHKKNLFKGMKEQPERFSLEGNPNLSVK